MDFLIKKSQKCCIILKPFIFLQMERRIVLFGDYFNNFIRYLNEDVRKKIDYVLDMLKSLRKINSKFVKHIREGLFE